MASHADHTNAHRQQKADSCLNHQHEGQLATFLSAEEGAGNGIQLSLRISAKHVVFQSFPC